MVLEMDKSYHFSKIDSIMVYILLVWQLKQNIHIGGLTQQMFDTAF